MPIRAPRLISRRLYSELLRWTGMRQLAIPVEVVAPVGGIAVTLHREGRDFTAREVGLGRLVQVALITTLGRHDLAQDDVNGSADGRVPRRPSTATVLTDRQWEVLVLLSREVGVDEIAATLFISRHTVVTHRRDAYRRLGISNARQARRWLDTAGTTQSLENLLAREITP